MSWQLDEAGMAILKAADAGFQLCWNCNDPQQGVQLCDVGSSATTSKRETSLLRLLPSDSQSLPPLDECYVRVDDLICRYPQSSDTQFGMDVCHRVIGTDGGTIVIETICAVQTSLLDSHPTFDISASATTSEAVAAANGLISNSKHPGNPVSLDLPGSSSLPDAITRLGQLESANADVYLMLPPSDRSVAAVIAPPENGQAFRYRLLADFLEKGVIRKARFWTVIFNQSASESTLAECYQQLLGEPLPLTP